jgi:hypothetical protein
MKNEENMDMDMDMDIRMAAGIKIEIGYDNRGSRII